MTYYKLINGINFVGVITQDDFRVFQQKHQVILACNEEKAQYVQYDDGFYRANWMVPVTTDKISYETVEVIRIDEQEYKILLKALETNKEIIIETEPEFSNIENPIIDPNDEITIEYIKESKIAEMSYVCNKIIENGVNVTLGDGKKYHFSLTTHDQLNLITLSSMVASGETQIPYHADGELCRFYSADDINTIITTATQFKTYQISYFNALKAYIESMTDIETIGAVLYGMEIPAEHQSDVLKVLLAAMATGGETE